MAYWHLLVLAVAAGTIYLDLRWRRIPNWLLLPALLLALALRGWEGGWPAVWAGLQGWLVGIGLLLLPYLRRGVGGGDVKLLGVLGACGGPLFALHTFLLGAVLGGLVSLYLLVRSSLLRPALRVVWWEFFLPGSLPLSSGLFFPYGVCFALGGVLALWW
ncbi:peptidase A24A prepilin type IV [Ammonifex degensii KC4]|uniref:Peptidase A24A prepilin type IV n=1 Tax=Ammonifex degensii (strain DSM 10501 / KC4) TaxID=429009 RepID=C9RD42_AMMDK|nr:prepilin peptidase [Ammonifex degensii]ACX52169.1 peptidase A24A prepilin type IV [Ammonifex degensii KC4]